MFKPKLILLILLSGMIMTTQAQKVGLVLSGGGAKGLAHIGVIKALEEHNIPIDYLIGTSMGGVIAGCYAAGYSAAEIEAMMLSPNFSKWVSGKPEDGYDFYYGREDLTPSFLNLKLSLDSTFNASIGSSLASDLSLNFALSENLAQAAAVAAYNFDSLLIPLRIVAADIFTQDEVIIKGGSLGNALRATLSVPFFYKPIRLDGKYLFDGGIYNNFPVDVAIEEFNPDIIIGVNVSSKIFEEYPYDSDDMLLNNSLLFMLLDKSEPDIIPDTGVYIEPNLSSYSALDFSNSKAMIDSGYVAGIRMIKEIKTKVSTTCCADTLKQRRAMFNVQKPPYAFSGIAYHGFNSKQKKYINSIFQIKRKRKDQLTITDIKSGYFRLVSEQYFRTIYPDITYDKTTRQYQLEMYGRPQNNLNIEIGGVIASRNVSQLFMGVDLYYFDNYLLKNSIKLYAGNFYKSAQIKSRLNLPVFQQFYIEPTLTYNNWDYLDIDDVFKKNQSPSVFDFTDRKYGINVGFPIGAKYKIVLNTAWINNTNNYANTLSVASSDTLDRQDLSGIRAGFSMSRDNLNRKQYASEGKSFKLSADYFNLSEKYTPGSTAIVEEKRKDRHEWFRTKLSMEQYFKKGHYSTGYLLEAVISNQPFFSNYYGSIINAPAFYPLQDSRTLFLEKFRAHSYIAGGLRNVYRIRPNLDFRLEGYVFKGFDPIIQSEEQQPIYDDFIEGIYFSGTATMVMHSPVGPISLSLNYYDDRNMQLSVLLQVGFLLFQNTSLD